MKFFDRFRKDKEPKKQGVAEPARPDERLSPSVEPVAPPAAPSQQPDSAAADADTAAPAPVAPPAATSQAVVAPMTPTVPPPSPAEPAAPKPVPKPSEPVAEATVAQPQPRARPTAVPAVEPAKSGLFARLKAGLKRTSSSFNEGLGNLFLGRKEIDDELLEDLETQLLLADVGIDATQAIIGNLTRRVSRKELADVAALYRALQQELAALLQPCAQPLVLDNTKKPYVILMVGVNGVGKTTTIGKLARRYSDEGRAVMLAAGDTFRAAAVEQLQVWGERNKVPVIAQHTGADSASVLFDALQAAQARKMDVLIADTAGRLHTKDHLMEELKKVVRVLKKLDPSAPHEVMLVLDAGTGQNAVAQVKHFQQAVGVTGITLTKLDGTAKGGVIFAVSKQSGVPIRFIGVGEQAEDLRPFDADEFVRALFQLESAAP